MSSQGQEFVAHAGVLAATSSMLAQTISECHGGNYTIVMPLSSIVTDAFVKFAYTGLRHPSHTRDETKLELFCDLYDEKSHDEHIISSLSNFAEKGLFCNMAWCNAEGLTQPTHSYIVAAQFDFMSLCHNIS